MPLPPLSNWDRTRIGLHRAAQVIGAIRAAAIDPLPNWAHLGLYVTPRGLTTGPTRAGELALDFAGSAVTLNGTHIALAGHTQISLADAVVKALAQAGHEIEPNRAKITDQAPLAVDSRAGGDYAEALFRIYSAIARFRGRLLGPMSPMIVWPHGFDLSFLWFAGMGMEERQDAHMNFGFSPGSPGLERPYIYAYAWPLPDGLTSLPLPAPARWHTAGWTGMVLAYDHLAGEHDPEGVIESVLRDVHRTVAPRLG